MTWTFKIVVTLLLRAALFSLGDDGTGENGNLRSLFGLHVHSCTYWLRPRNPPPPPAFGLTYEGAIGQQR